MDIYIYFTEISVAAESSDTYLYGLNSTKVESKIYGVKGTHSFDGVNNEEIAVLIYAKEKENHVFVEVKYCDITYTRYDAYYYRSTMDDMVKAHYLDKGEIKAGTSMVGGINEFRVLSLHIHYFFSKRQ